MGLIQITGMASQKTSRCDSHKNELKRKEKKSSNSVLLGEVRNTYKILVRNSKSKEPLQTSRHSRWTDIFKMLKKYGMTVWIGFTWLRIGFSGKCLLMQ
jgi:hypothetical protein